MSELATKQEREYLNALGYSSTGKISKVNRSLISKLVQNNIPVKAVSIVSSKHNYIQLKETDKRNYINNLIEAYKKHNKRLREDVEIISDEEDEFIDAKERVPKPKPNLKHIQTINVNNNLSKMSKGGLKIKPKVNYNDRLDFMKYEPSEHFENLDSFKQVFDGKYKDVFEDKNHPYWNKTTRYNSRLEHPNYAAYYAAKHEGKAYRDDFNDDGIDDIVITNKAGNVTHINGHSMSKTKRGVNLEYFDSDDYAKLNHYYTNKNGKKVLQLIDPTAKNEWIDELSTTTKKELNKELRKAGMAGFKIKDENVANILKENAKIVYENVISTLVGIEKSKNKGLDKKELRSSIMKHLPKTTFASRIVNAILLKVSGLFDKKAPQINDEDLPFYLTKLKKLFNKTENNRQRIFKYGNEMLKALLDMFAEESEFAEAIYMISSDKPTLKSYEKLCNIIEKALEISNEITEDKYYYDGIRTKKGELQKRPVKKAKK